MAIYDISIPISPTMIVWPQDPPVEITQPRHFDKGDHAVVSHISMSAHTGTHVDAPGHFIPGGGSVDTLDLEVLVGPAVVVRPPDVDLLTADVLEQIEIPIGTKRILFQTRNSDLWSKNHAQFDESFVAIREDGARWLIDRGMRLVGIDYLSVAPYSNTGPTHRLLLAAGIVLLEGLDLSAVQPGPYQLVCLPLSLTGIEGAPARAILMD
jgi:arylformamidase